MKKHPWELQELPQGIKRIKNIEYNRTETASPLMDIYIHENAKGPLPAILWIPGGAWAYENKEKCLPAAMLLKEGYIMASINCRLTSTAVFPAQIEDSKAAVRFLRAKAGKYNIDSGRIGAWGASAGGHLASLLGTTAGVKEFDRGENLNFPSSVKAVCNYYGPSSITEMARLRGETSAELPEAQLIGGAISENKEKAEKASPLAYIDKNTCPFLIVQGDMDATVDVSLSKLLHEALKKAGVESRLEILKGAKHSGPPFVAPATIKLVSAFFGRHLKGA